VHFQQFLVAAFGHSFGFFRQNDGEMQKNLVTICLFYYNFIIKKEKEITP